MNQKPLFPVILLIVIETNVDCDDLKGDEDEDVCDYNFNFELFCIKEASKRPLSWSESTERVKYVDCDDFYIAQK